MQLCADKVKEILKDKNSVLSTLISPDGINDIIEHPESISSPWYGQLMAGPQLVAYCLQILYWIETYHVDLTL